MAAGFDQRELAVPPPPVRRGPSVQGSAGGDRRTNEVLAARALTREVSNRLLSEPSFRQLSENARAGLIRDLDKIQNALSFAESAPAQTLDTPNDLRRRLFQGQTPEPQAPSEPPPEAPAQSSTPGPKRAATETLAQRAGALIDEIDFPTFVAGLVHGTFDAIVDAAIRQMESFADLVSAVAKDVDTFTSENVSTNQARDWLVEKFPADLEFDREAGEPLLRPRRQEDTSPAWLADYGLAGELLTGELAEQSLVPETRRRLGESRLQLLATMVLLGMNRVVVKDGSIRARVRFRAAARDKADVEYAASQDPGGTTSGWGTRGSGVYQNHSTMISTGGVNAQTESNLQAELFGEVQINFASETVPLDRFVDQARMTLLQRHARASNWQAPAAASVPAQQVGAPAAAPALPTAPAPQIPVAQVPARTAPEVNSGAPAASPPAPSTQVPS